jgi:hypothetical protein
MPLSHVGTFAASSEIIVHSVLSFFSSAVVYMITRFACINGSISEFTGVVDTKACIGKPFLDLFEDAAVKLMPGEVMVV